MLLGLGVALGLIAATSGAAIVGCGSAGGARRSAGGGAESPEASGPCPIEAAAPAVLPGVRAEERTAAYWIGRSPDPDVVVLGADDIARHEAAFRAAHDASPNDDPLTHEDIRHPPSRALVEHELGERLSYLGERVKDGRYLAANGEKLSGDAARVFEAPAATPPLLDELRRVEQDATLWCGPRAEGLFKGPEPDLAFDRNVCSTVRQGEVLRVVARWPGGMQLVRTPYAFGWLAGDAALSAPLGRVEADAALAPSRRDMTRRAVSEEAFRHLDSPYGWGGKNGGRDCSRFLMDVFGAFGLDLPRHSGGQAQAGSMVIDVTPLKSEREREVLLDAAQERGIVLLHFPGHIMLYLGRNDAERPMVMHAFAEYLEACGAEEAAETGRKETLRRVDRVQVSDMTLGRGTSRTSFLERLTHVTILGQTPGPALLGAVTRRPAAPVDEPERCGDSEQVTMLTSPRRPHPGAPLRVLVAAERDLGSVAIELTGPSGRHRPTMHRMGGPPFGYWAELPAPAEGKWTVRIGDGDRIEACEALTVHEEGDTIQANGGRVWTPQRRWTPGMENLFALWVEQLFDYPLDDRTWPNLKELLASRDHNVLHGHLGQGEEDKLTLKPDCADLPYFLRAYFSWKLRLPFAYRHCNRGFDDKAPYCDHDLKGNLATIEDAGTEVRAFDEFARLNVANGVHSGSGRCAPQDSENDYYPIALARPAIKPGTMFADPYGHLFVIAKWVPQGVGDYGILVGADAQPDGTIGRRRFWPGSFLFTPDTSLAGAGFKAFRPTTFSRGRLRQTDNAAIAGLGLTPFSMQQYEGSKQDFYDRVEALINPRPLEPEAMLDVLIAALHEQVKRRVVSVQNAEDYKAGRRGAIEMPSGHSIFETTGAWENYSTPSRDMRLLIAMDTVLGFPDGVKRAPERFGVAAAEVDARVAELRAYLDRELRTKTFAYRRSDGSDQPLTVKDVVDRAEAFEMAYNPNDCVEIRWAAPEGSAERSPCRQFAPAAQRNKMAGYRSWFAERKRPAR